MKDQYDDDALYPNQPLSDVACEIRFRGEMAVECQRYLFWDKIRDEYSDVLVPFVQEGQAAALQHYKFRDPKSGRTVSVALNSLAFSESKYSGHKSFINEFLRLVRLFSETYPKIAKLSRIGWRYINVIPFSREDGLVPINRFVTLSISFPEKVFQSTSELDLQWAGKCLDGDVRIHIAAAQQKDGSLDQPVEAGSRREALLFDIDFAQTRSDMKWTDVETVVSDARSKARKIFEGLITDDYRKYLRGETL